MPEGDQDNIVLERLREIRANQDTMMEILGEHSQQLSELRRNVASIRRDQGADAESVILQMDRTNKRLDRIERRLELRDDAQHKLGGHKKPRATTGAAAQPRPHRSIPMRGRDKGPCSTAR